MEKTKKILILLIVILFSIIIINTSTIIAAVSGGYLNLLNQTKYLNITDETTKTLIGKGVGFPSGTSNDFQYVIRSNSYPTTWCLSEKQTDSAMRGIRENSSSTAWIVAVIDVGGANNPTFTKIFDTNGMKQYNASEEGKYTKARAAFTMYKGKNAGTDNITRSCAKQFYTLF